MANINKMFVVREQKDLSPFGEIDELRNDCFRSLIVECYQKIIQDEWHWLVFLQVALHCCKPKGKVKLVSGPVAHPIHRDIRPIFPSTNNYWNIFVIEFRR